MTNDNAAARLHAILERGKKLNENSSAKNAWMYVFNLSSDTPNYESILMSKLGQVMLLPHETRSLIEQYYPQQAQSLDHTILQIQKGFTNQNLSSSWKTFIQHIDDHCISTLSMSAALLDNKLETKLIDNETLGDFKERVQELFDETITSSLGTEFKKFITHYLQKIINAINDYLISGALPILDAIHSTLGHAVLDPKFKQDLVETESGNKISNMLGDLANIVTVASAATGAATYLATNGIPLLGS
ncbi:hypothetical protein F0231_20335 [Vibrio sp. RE86]|uniref:hypothetical protein n=1 Tax=Vibrio sp. RE86 TaxID=2607605 RepID=UPI001493DA58|nr:hypothetical protein [Vibrio sp. RE86]NOH82070.1 hypothetical protein [Vibrio sp. RE86]